jgi:hypothetical protein
MEETLERGRGPPRAVAPLEREREEEEKKVVLYTSLVCRALSALSTLSAQLTITK